MIALTVPLDQPRLKVGADLGKDRLQFHNCLAVEETAAVLGYEDQMNMHGKHAVSTVPKVLALVHRADHYARMERRQAFQFELMPNGEQQRQMSRSAGCARYVYNQGLALQKERYEKKKEKLTRFQLDKMLVEWKQATPWLAEAPAHALQQVLLDLERAYTNFFRKRAQFPKFHKKGLRDSFRESDPKCIQAKSRQQPHSVAQDGMGALSQQPGGAGRGSQCHGQLIGWPMVCQYHGLSVSARGAKSSRRCIRRDRRSV